MRRVREKNDKNDIFQGKPNAPWLHKALDRAAAGENKLKGRNLLSSHGGKEHDRRIRREKKEFEFYRDSNFFFGTMPAPPMGDFCPDYYSNSTPWDI